ncbi:hypothetical protein KSP39_PZI001875 [Platanthera zijinensis]|uniref:Uncharacterized protein n=1 Tax=Platanthera zijinensis TaxID=2320716 RepID=A0AAP0C0Y9_9ASPA
MVRFRLCRAKKDVGVCPKIVPARGGLRHRQIHPRTRLSAETYVQHPLHIDLIMHFIIHLRGTIRLTKANSVP